MKKISRFSLALGLSLFTISGGAAAQETGALGPTLDRVVARNAVYVGYREAALPFSYQMPGQAVPVGYLWEICGHVVKTMQEKIGKAVPLVPVAVTDNARVMMLKTGITDLDCGGAASTVVRQKQVGLSYTVYVSELRVLVRKGVGIERFEQLADKRVVVLNGGVADRQVKQNALTRNINLQLLQVNTPAEAMALLAKGEVDAYVGDDATLAAQRATQKDGYELLVGGLAAEPYAIMLPKDDAVLKKLVDETLLSLMQSGELARIYDKWFISPIPPANLGLDLPMSTLLKAAIQAPNDKPVN